MIVRTPARLLAPFLLAAALALASVACSGIKADATWDTGYPFAGDSYAWARVDASGAPVLPRDVVDLAVREAVDEEMRRRGFVERDRSEADYVLLCRVLLWEVSREVAWQETTASGLEEYRAAEGSTDERAPADNYAEGSVTLELFDGRSEARVWTASAEGFFTAAYPQEDQLRKLLEAIVGSLEDFPPRAR